LMRFEAQRAHAYYESGWQLVPRLSPSGRAVFLMMARTYRELLVEIEKRDYDVFRSRVRVPSWKKAMFALAALPARFGWI
jgi:phytoene synthase